jgi:SulP family sulfate permease
LSLKLKLPNHSSGVLSTRQLARQLLAGLTVSFVAISLGAAFGVLSGRGAVTGILSAGVIALITAALGGTRVQCSGLTAPMTAEIR